MFIAIEGNDGSGKTTLIKNMKENHNFAGAHFTREPGGTELGWKIRDLLLNPLNGKKSPMVEFLMFMADRIHHVETFIKPKLLMGHDVITDRFLDSTYAYQVGASGLPEETFNSVVNATMGEFRPDIVILLLCPPAIAIKRMESRSGDRFDDETIDFHHKVFDALYSKKDNANYYFVDGSLSETVVFHVVNDIIAAERDKRAIAVD